MAQEKDRRSSWSSAAEVVKTLLQRLPMGNRLQEYRVWGVWKDAVGETIACHAQPSKIQKGLLFVTVSNSMWMQELQFLKPVVKEKINEQLGEAIVKDIFFVLGRGRREHQEEPKVPSVRRQEPFVELTVPSLKNEKIEEALTALLAARRRRLQGKDAP